MADEIPGQNVIRLVQRLDDGWWEADIADNYICAVGSTPSRALRRLASRLEKTGYVFDPSWKPRD